MGNYKKRHDNVAKVLNSALAKKWGLRHEITPLWEYQPFKVDIQMRELKSYGTGRHTCIERLRTTGQTQY